MRKTLYHDMQRSHIREFVSFSACPTLDDMIFRAHEQEMYLEHVGKRKAEHKKRPGFDEDTQGLQL